MSAQKSPVFQTVTIAYRDGGRVSHAMRVLTGTMIAILIAFNLASLFASRLFQALGERVNRRS
jgi:hypothetical protein